MRVRVALILVAVFALCGCGTGVGVTQTTPTATVTHHRHRRHHARVHHVVLVHNALPQPGWHSYTGPVPILVYHELGEPPPGAPFPRLYVSDSDFEAEMAWLHSNGYQAVTLDEMMNAWFHGAPLPHKPIVITFDNGYPPQVTFAPRVMARYGWPGVLNEITEHHLYPWQIRPILRMGWEVDSHSLTHPDLTTLGAAELLQQVAGSREYLRQTFHVPVNSFCYPSSRYNNTVIAAVRAAGYTNATTENPGYATSSEPFTLPRFEIESGVSQLAEDLLHYQPAAYLNS
jgi:peptidoglycan/xylan/chitin deacetylase (PgdA/CDA1 family)